MRSRTELMETILTSETAQKIIDYVSPVYGEAYVCLWLFQIIGAALDELKSFPEEFVNQVTPVTATWTINFWEDEYEIPHGYSLSIEQRRLNILNKIRKTARMNPANIEKIIESMSGMETSIYENTGKNCFEVAVQGNLRDNPEIKSEIIQFIDRVKPAHLIYILHEAIDFECVFPMYTAVVSSESETCDISFGSSDALIRVADEKSTILQDSDGSIFIY